MHRFWATACCFLGAIALPRAAQAVSSAEFYTATSYPYGRFEARARFTAGDGIISSFFLWKEGSDQPGSFWNELDFEKVGAECRLESNPLYGNPAVVHAQRHTVALDLCGAFHTYAYEWTPTSIAWLVDGMEIRRETGAAAQAYADNAGAKGMSIHLNLWPGDASFGGNFNPAILPVHEYVDWVQYSKYENGAFTLAWREDFNGPALPSGWLTGTWVSPKNLSTNSPKNVNILSGYAVLSLTADDKQGPAGAMSGPGAAGSSSGGSGAGGAAGSSSGGSGSSSGGSGAGGAAGSSSGGSGSSSGGSGSSSGGSGSSGAAGSTGGGAAAGGSPTAGGANAAAGSSATGGASTAAGAPNGSAGTGAPLGMAGAGGLPGAAGSASSTASGGPNATSGGGAGTAPVNYGTCSFGHAPRNISLLGAAGLVLVWFGRRRAQRR